MWQVGLDYPHGTGHGVGAFLNVVEGMLNLIWPYCLSFVNSITQDRRASVVRDQFLRQFKQIWSFPMVRTTTLDATSLSHDT